jgi:hypothetical protein
MWHCPRLQWFGRPAKVALTSQNVDNENHGTGEAASPLGVFGEPAQRALLTSGPPPKENR